MASRKRFHPDCLILSSSTPKRLYCLSSDSSSFVDSSPAHTVASFPQHHEHGWDPGCLTVLDSASNLSSCDSKGSSPAELYHVIYTKCSDPPLKLKREVSCDALKNSNIGCEEEGSDVTYERNMKPHFGDPCSSASRGSDAEPYVNTRFAGSKRDTIFPNPSSVSSHMTEGSPCDSYASSIGKRNSGRQKWSVIENEAPACMTSSSSGEQQFNNFLTEERMSGYSLLNTYPSLCRGVSSSSKGTYSKSGLLPRSISYERAKEVFHLEGSHNSARILPVDPKPSYVLSSGRLSLEEEARLGRRPSTIDQDFEDYFSSLML